MSEQFFLSLQQNIKLMIWAPLLATIFRIIFIIVYNPYPSLRGRWQSLIGGSTIWFLVGVWILMLMYFDPISSYYHTWIMV